MKLSAIFQAFAIASLSSTGLATLFFEELPSNLTIGDKIKLNWTADHDYTLSMSFMKRNIGASQTLSSVFYDLPMASGNMSYDWTVPNITVVAGDQFSLELFGTGPMDPEGTRNRTNVFELPVNVSERSEDLSPMLCDNHLYPGAIAGITVGCVAAFLLGAAVAWLALHLRQKRKTAGAGFEQVENRAPFDGAADSKVGGKEAA